MKRRYPMMPDGQQPDYNIAPDGRLLRTWVQLVEKGCHRDDNAFHRFMGFAMAYEGDEPHDFMNPREAS